MRIFTADLCPPYMLYCPSEKGTSLCLIIAPHSTGYGSSFIWKVLVDLSYETSSKIKVLFASSRLSSIQLFFSSLLYLELAWMELKFLQFPREIRDIIYYFLHNELQRYGERTKDNASIQQRSELSAQFLRTCHQIHDEASIILYNTQPIQFNIWCCGEYHLYADPYQPHHIRKYIKLIQSIQFSIIVIREDEHVPSILDGLYRQEIPSASIKSTVLEQLFTQGSPKEIALIFYFNRLSDQTLQSLNMGNLHSLSKWDRRDVTETTFSMLGLDLKGKQLRINNTHDGGMEGRTNQNHLIWRLKWKNSSYFFQVRYMQRTYPFPCFLTNGHFVLVHSDLTLHSFAGKSINIHLAAKMEFHYRLKLVD